MQDHFDISHVYAIYARAIDEKRYDLLDRVFTPEAELQYEVGPHKFDCKGAESAKYFGEFLQLCYWTNHLIAPPMIEIDGNSAFATARVISTHLQTRDDGSQNRWTLRGSYHDQFIRSDGRWLIAKRFCVCTDSEGEFMPEHVEHYPALAYTESARLKKLPD